ncbi:MAG: DNA polymerase, partial [Gemmatimonadota bacterium]
HEALPREGFTGKMLLQVHDELVFECPLDEVEALSAMVRREMTSAVALAVPLVVDIGTGANWVEAKA